MLTTSQHQIGWLGAALILGGYMLLSLDVIGNDWRYHACMLTGSSCVAWIAYKSRLWEVVALNIGFATFGLIALIRLLLV